MPENICYVDESGTGDEPIATMVGIVLDSSRMHVTKEEWAEFLRDLSETAGRDLAELHTRDFYSGSGRFNHIDGPQRAEIISGVFDWLKKRKHSVVYAAVEKAAFHAAREEGAVPEGLDTVWRFMAFHLTLALQQLGMKSKVPKGHTILVFDREGPEEAPLAALLANPPDWSDAYYSRGKKQRRLDQIVDAPYFHDSKLVSMLQVADFGAFFLRRFAETSAGVSELRYEEEGARLVGWMDEFKNRTIGRQYMYRSQGVGDAHRPFIELAPRSVVEL